MQCVNAAEKKVLSLHYVFYRFVNAFEGNCGLVDAFIKNRVGPIRA